MLQLDPKLLGLALQANPHPRLLDLMLQLDPKLLGLSLQAHPLKVGSCKFNIIINIKNIIIYIINITLRSDIVVKLKVLEFSFIDKPNAFKS
jgi:hypothetical protein